MEHWARHARFEDVASRIQDSLAHLFDPKMPYFKPRILLRCVDAMIDVYPRQLSSYSTKPDKETPLLLAAFCGFSRLIEHLIVTHALDVNAECGDRRTPLLGASYNGQVDSARILLDSGADVNAKGWDDFTPLHYASYYGHLKTAQLLLRRGASLNARTNLQKTPLHLASQGGHLEILRVLLDHGADVTVLGAEGLTLYKISTGNGHRDVAQLLLERGAKRE